MPNLDDIIWAAVTFEGFSYNSAYLHVLRHTNFLSEIRYAPQDMDVDRIRIILVQFLNDWGCRLRNYDNVTASNLKNSIIDAHPELLAVQNYSILDFNFEDPNNRGRIEHIFNKFWNYGSRIARNFGPTCTSKTLHIINPNFFTMWDEAIRVHYWANNHEIIDSGRGYCFFQIEIKRIAEQLVVECIERYNTDNPALWLSERLDINPPLSLVKFIDEFNWLAYKRILTRPPDWVCPF